MFISRLVPRFIKNKIKERFEKTVVKTVYSATKPYELFVSQTPEMTNQIAVVTGGSGAIGRSICIRLASMGAKVFVVSRSEVSAMNVVVEIRQLGLKAEPLVLNVADDDSVEKVFDYVQNTEGRLDILVCCAGGSSREAMTSLNNQSIKVIDEILNINLRGAILCTRKAAQIMQTQQSGKIVLISSAVGIQGKANYSEYGAAKSGMFGFVKSVALELGKYNINVNCVSPGFIQRGEYDDAKLEWIKKTNPMKKVGTLEDIANAVSFLASDKASFITGQNLCVDGGRTLGLFGDSF